MNIVELRTAIVEKLDGLTKYSRDTHLSGEYLCGLIWPYIEGLQSDNERLRKLLHETTAEAIEHRKNIIEARAADFQGIANPRYANVYQQEIARMDALIERARAALAPPPQQSELKPIRSKTLPEIF